MVVFAIACLSVVKRAQLILTLLTMLLLVSFVPGNVYLLSEMCVNKTANILLSGLYLPFFVLLAIIFFLDIN